jgi:hypothetical protein
MQKGLRRLPRNVWVMSAIPLLNDISSEMFLKLIPFFLANILEVCKVGVSRSDRRIVFI